PAGAYIVRTRDGVDAGAVAADHGRRLGVRARYVYRASTRGYAAEVTATQLAAVRRDRRVRAVEPDRPVHVRLSWGLDRIDQAALPLDGRFRAPGDGAGTTIYVIDTGVRATHEQLAGRVESGFDAVDGGAADDCNGHGTHVAGIAAGATTGVASAAHVVAVRVLGCDGSGSTSSVIAGIDWVTAHHPAGRPAVANLSLGGGPSAALDEAVHRSIASGVTYVVAAGNGDAAGVGVSACGDSPARVRDAVTVGAAGRDDRAAPFSNFGSCVDVYAPGVDIPSAWDTGDRAEATLSGTSMAAPFVAGAAAVYLGRHASASPAQVERAVRAAATVPVEVPGRRARGRLLQLAGL
ncbi:MAG TPA: S8 family peptidase, partial [Acidimicrobiales bacterium]|nr:S8 family peptidase [Acidimicrobiales bacterium]